MAKLLKIILFLGVIAGIYYLFTLFPDDISVIISIIGACFLIYCVYQIFWRESK